MVHKRFWLSAVCDLTASWGGRMLLLLVGGVLTGLTLVFNQMGFLQWLTLIPAAYVLLGLMQKENVKLRNAYGYGFFFFMSYYLVIYHWFIYLYPLEFTGMSRGSAVLVVLAGWFGMSVLQSLSGGLVFVFAVLLGRTKTVKNHGILMPFFVSALWVIFEWSQTLFWIGVPWGRLAIGQSAMPIMLGTACIFGSYFITFLLVAVNFIIAYGIYKKGKAKLYIIVAAGMVVLNITVGGAVLLYNAYAEEEKINAAVIQANIGSADKWDIKLADMLDIYEGYTRSAAASHASLIIWPETAVPVTVERSPLTVKRLLALSAECGVPILAGAFTEDEEGNPYNSLVLFRPDGKIDEQVYSKRHLVPFGEYMPLRNLISTLLPPLAKLAMLEEDVYPGVDSSIIESGGVKYGSLICFDSIYEQLTRASVLDSAEVLVISTNDSWFLDSAAGRMHNAQAKLRAIESGRWVLRAANTGISSVITPAGVTVEKLEPLVGGYIVAEVGIRNGMTLYMQIGNVFIAASMLFCLMPAGIWAFNKIRHRDSCIR